MNIEGIINVASISFCYVLLIIALSSFILRCKLKNEDIFKRFMMYTVFGNLYISSIVFLLAYLNILNKFTLIAFVLIFSISIRVYLDKERCVAIGSSSVKVTKNLILGRYGFNLFASDIYNGIKRWTRKLSNELFAGKEVEWLIFIIIIVYNLYRYGTNPMSFTTYMAPDEEVHLYWIQSLIKGSIYPSGVYPHVFHNIMVALIEVFNINAMELIQLFSITSCMFIMIMLYIGLRRTFKFKYSALLGLMIYSVANLYPYHATNRFQFTIPQEYGMIMLMPMAMFLFDYIRDRKRKDLIFFGMAFSLSFGIHVYTGIVAIILVGSIMITYLYKIIKEKMLAPLMICFLISAVITVVPLATGLALGHEIEQSMNWAIEVIKGDVYKDDAEQSKKKLEQDKDDKEKNEEEEIEERFSLETFKNDARSDLIKYGVNDIRTIYFFISILIATIIYNVVLVKRKKNNEESLYKISFSINILILISLMVFKALRLPTIMEPKRVMIFVAYFSPLCFGIPLDFILKRLRHKAKESIPLVSALTIGLVLVIIDRGNFIRPLPPFYYFQTSGTMKSNMSIIRDYKDYTWTAISPVNNISSILNNGFHYELDDFMIDQEHWNKDKETRIPTEYVFIYIEKKPITDYGDRFYKNDPQIVNRSPFKIEDASEAFKLDKEEDNYIYKKQREILMAKAYSWAKEYEKYYPNEMNVYYEDSELIVYRVHQNPYALNNFNIDYKINRK